MATKKKKKKAASRTSKSSDAFGPTRSSTNNSCWMEWAQRTGAVGGVKLPRISKTLSTKR